MKYLYSLPISIAATMMAAPSPRELELSEKLAAAERRAEIAAERASDAMAALRLFARIDANRRVA